MAATSTRKHDRLRCDACGDVITATERAGAGVHVRADGDRLVRDDLPLCERCALSIGMTFLVRLATEEDEG